MGRSTFSGPIASTNGAILGGGTQITQIKKGVISVVVGALAAGVNADVSLTISGAAAGDSIQLTPLNAAMEDNLAVCAVWVSAANTVKVRLRNTHASAALTGSTANWQYLLIKS